jgi:cytoskeletal protein CcmA (bactofilin family)
LRSAKQAPPAREPGLSVIAVGTRVEGDLTSDGVIKVEGTVVGTVRAAHQVLVAKEGVIEGDVYTREAVLGGEVRGTIVADERVEVQSTSVVNGDIVTRRLAVHEGGEVNGHIRMGELARLSPASIQPDGALTSLAGEGGSAGV